MIDRDEHIELEEKFPNLFEKLGNVLVERERERFYIRLLELSHKVRQYADTAELVELREAIARSLGDAAEVFMAHDVSVRAVLEVKAHPLAESYSTAGARLDENGIVTWAERDLGEEVDGRPELWQLLHEMFEFTQNDWNTVRSSLEHFYPQLPESPLSVLYSEDQALIRADITRITGFLRGIYEITRSARCF